MNVKAWLTALLIGSSFTASAVASPTYNEAETIDEHISLLNTIKDMGINVQINNPIVCKEEPGTMGMWDGENKAFWLCQEVLRDAKTPIWNGAVYLATDEDLDTIRHEAHHIIQDCQDGDINGRLHPYMDDDSLRDFLAYYPDDNEEQIAKLYRDFGAPEHIVKIEIEAWAVAEMIPVEMIKEALISECEV